MIDKIKKIIDYNLIIDNIKSDILKNIPNEINKTFSFFIEQQFQINDLIIELEKEFNIFTEEELDEIINFQESNVGKKLKELNRNTQINDLITSWIYERYQKILNEISK